VNDFASLMSHDALLGVLREQLPRCLPVLREALRLLLECDNGVWFTDRQFVASVVDDALPGPEGHPVQVNFTKLARVLDDARRAEPWTYRHGPAASGVLWLACELAGGRLLELANNSDPATDRLVNALMATVFRRDPGLGELTGGAE